MKDDSTFNIQLAHLIQQHPCLYDNTCLDYSRKRMQNQAWAKIAKEVSGSVKDCKERWKSLRRGFTRHIKIQKEASLDKVSVRKPYYLAQYLNFLRPFTKTYDDADRNYHRSLQMSSTEREETKTEDTVDDISIKSEEMFETVEEISHSLIDHSENSKLPDLEQQQDSNSIEPVYFEEKPPLECSDSPKFGGNEAKNDDADWSFFKSVMPDMQEMNNAQKRRFKIGILQLASDILSEPTPATINTLNSN